MNKIKIIDLLNMISKGEEVPQKIKVGNKIYNYETFNIGKGDNYFTAEWEKVKGYRINYDGIYYYLEIRDYNLNDEVEIIEEDKKIDHIYHCCMEPSSEETKFLIQNINDLADKINEIIDYLKSKGD